MPLTLLSTDEIREILVRRVDQQKQAVGIVAGVIEPNGRRIVAYGNLAAGDPRTLDGDTIFEIGSVSKVFTSLVLADMVQRHEVKLDDPALAYLPEHVNVSQRSGTPISLLDLSTHRSGLPPFPTNLKLNLTQGELKDTVNVLAFYGVDDLYQFLSGYELPRDPGAEFEYSNLGAGLLGHILAHRAGSDYESLIRIRVTQPLNMPDTAVRSSSSMKQRAALGHRATLAPIAHNDWDPSHALTGAGALRSSTNDLLTFLEAFLGYKESPLAPAMKAMLEVRRPAGQIEIGLAWLIRSTAGREIAFHNGGTAGFRSFIGYDPKERVGVVVLSNASTLTGIDDIGFHLLNPKLALADPEPPTEHIQVPIDPTLLDGYTGRYQVKSDLILEITRDADRLFAQGFAELNGQTVALPRFEVFAEGEKSFFAKVSEQQIVFETGPDGRATSLVLIKAGREMSGARLS